MSEKTKKESGNTKKVKEKKPRPKKDVVKDRKWAQDRRRRLNDALEFLHKTLPDYDPSSKLSHIEILQQASAQLKELTEKVKNLLVPNAEVKDEKDKLIKKLEIIAKKLVIRNEQLCNLLKDAGISIPTECGVVRKFRSQYKWSGRISVEQAKIIQKKALDTNKDENITPKSSKPRKRKLRLTSPNCVAPKHRKVAINSSDAKKILKRKKFCKPQTTMVILPQPPTFNQPCLILSNPVPISDKTTSKTVITNSPLLTTPILSSTIKAPVIARNPNLKTLGPGTIILTNPSGIPIIPQQQTIIPTTLIPAPVQNKTLVVVSSRSTIENKDTVSMVKTLRKLPRLLKKPCSTITTQVNKVPIPALTSEYSKYLVNSQIVNKNKRVVKVKKKIVNNVKKNVETKVEKEKSDNNVVKKVSSDNLVIEQSSIVNTQTNVESTVKKNSLTTTETQNSTHIETTNENIDFKTTQICPESTENTSTVLLSSDSNKTTNNIVETTHETNVISKMTEITSETHKNEPKESNNTLVEKPANELKALELNLPHSELSNDIFASLNVPNAGQNPGSTSPTAAFLLAFPLVSSGVKVTEVIDEDNSESQRETPQLLQIGTMDNTKTTQSVSDSLTPSFLNMDNFSFFYDKKSVANSDNVTQIMSRESSDLLNFQETGKNNTAVFDNFDSGFRDMTKENDSANSRGKNIENNREFSTKGKVDNVVNNTVLPSITYEPKMHKSSESNQSKVSQNQQNYNKNVAPQQNIVDYAPKINNITPNVDHVINSNYPIKNNEISKSNQNINYSNNKFDQSNIINDPNNLLYQNKCMEKPIHQDINTYTNSNKGMPQSNLNYKGNEQNCTYSNNNNSNNTNKINRNEAINHNNYQKQSAIKMNTKNDLISQNMNQIPQYQTKTNNKQHIEQHTTYNNKNDTNVQQYKNDNQINIQNISHVNYPVQQKNDQNIINPHNLYHNKQKQNDLNQNINQNYHKKQTDVTKQNYCNYEQKVATTYPATTKQQNYNDLYINSSSYNYNYPVDANFNHNYYKNSSKSYYPITYDNYSKNDSYITGEYYTNPQNKFAGNISPKNKNAAHNKPVNWMTTPDNNYKPDYPLTTFSKEDFFGTNSFVTTTATTYFNPCRNISEVKKSLELQTNSCQKEIEDNHFSWSPTRVPQFLDNSHNLMPSTLPTLVGDLALNNPPFIDQKKSKGKGSCESQNHFFSVSQLVEPQQAKENVNSNTKRINSNRNKSSSSPRSKKKDSSKKSSYNNLENFCEKSPRKNNYSAEALIGNHQQNESKKTSSKSLGSSFLSENLIPYFPPVELPQETTYNQNYQPNTFTHNFTPLPDFSNTHDIISDNLLQNKSRHCNKPQNCNKKTKKKPEETLPNFELPFLPVPVPNVNSPILPDDLHSHTSFLHPTSSYPCKNPLYGKQNPDLTPPPPLLGRLPVAARGAPQEMIAPVSGTSLTNFSVSNIFPEINKGHLPEIYPDVRIKDHAIARSFAASTTSQASTSSFHGKPTFSFSTYN